MRTIHKKRRCWAVLVWLVIIYSLGNLSLGFSEKKSTTEGKGSNDDSRQYLCCARHEKITSVGQGISGESIPIDIGQCRKLCPRQVSDDPGDASRPAVQKCLPHGHCLPKSTKLERISTIQGVRVIETIGNCECFVDSACRRESHTRSIYAGTPYQVNLDVGGCMGNCGKDDKSFLRSNEELLQIWDANRLKIVQPVLKDQMVFPISGHHVLGKLGRNQLFSPKNKWTGQNYFAPHSPIFKLTREVISDEVYQIINKCGCTGNCYRVQLMETVLDFSNVEIIRGVNTTDVKPIIKHIDVGQCVGSCPSNKTETCLLRVNKEPSRCLASLYLNQRFCISAKFKVHEYRNRRGSKREIIQITECVCV